MRRFLSLTLSLSLLALLPLQAKATDLLPECKYQKDLAAVESLSADLREVWGAADPDASFKELAVGRLVPLYRAVLTRLADFKEDTLPHDPREVTLVRKAVLALRRNVDLFAYVYPEKEITRLRDDLDEGYAVLGRFKELSDAQAGKRTRTYDDGEVNRLREEALSWKEAFTDRERVARTRRLLMNPGDPDGERSRKSLGTFAWGGVEEGVNGEMPGLKNVRRLVRASLAAAREEYIDTVKIADPLSASRRERFHDFKKRIRSIFYMLSDFPELKGGSKNVEEGRLLLFQTEERYGGIIDLLVALDTAEAKGDKKEARRLEGEIRQGWKELQRWQVEVDLAHRLKLLRLAL